jgi:hypothetical protein
MLLIPLSGLVDFNALDGGRVEPGLVGVVVLLAVVDYFVKVFSTLSLFGF